MPLLFHVYIVCAFNGNTRLQLWRIALAIVRDIHTQTVPRNAEQIAWKSTCECWRRTQMLLHITSAVTANAVAARGGRLNYRSSPESSAQRVRVLHLHESARASILRGCNLVYKTCGPRCHCCTQCMWCRVSAFLLCDCVCVLVVRQCNVNVANHLIAYASSVRGRPERMIWQNSTSAEKDASQLNVRVLYTCVYLFGLQIRSEVFLFRIGKHVQSIDSSWLISCVDR